MAGPGPRRNQAATDAALELLEGKLAACYHGELVGGISEVLVEGFSPVRPGWVQGTDRRYVTVEFPGSETDFNRFVRVRVTSVEGMCLVGERCETN